MLLVDSFDRWGPVVVVKLPVLLARFDEAASELNGRSLVVRGDGFRFVAVHFPETDFHVVGNDPPANNATKISMTTIFRRTELVVTDEGGATSRLLFPFREAAPMTRDDLKTTLRFRLVHWADRD